MATLTVPQKIAIAEISEYLTSVAILRGDKSIPYNLPQKIRSVRKPIEYRYALDPSDDTLEQTSNYMLSLCWNLNGAKRVSGNAGTIATIHPTSGTTNPDPYRFIVDASTTFMIDGESTKIITAFIGYHLLYTRGGIEQSTENDGGSYFSWSKATGSFTTFPALSTGESIQLIAI